MWVPFRDRRDAGRQLASALAAYTDSDVCVLGIPPGGVPVGYEIARALGAPLDVFVTRKLMAPGRRDAPLGVLGSNGARLLDRDVIYGSKVPPAMVDELTRIARAALLAEEADYRETGPIVSARDHTVILCDDGTASLATLRHCIQLVRVLEAAHVVVAVPALARGLVHALTPIANAVVTVYTTEVPEPLRWYSDFTMTTPGEIRALLALAEAERHARALFA
jgi:putative phosphoribosyl transferase